MSNRSKLFLFAFTSFITAILGLVSFSKIHKSVGATKSEELSKRKKAPVYVPPPAIHKFTFRPPPEEPGLEHFKLMVKKQSELEEGSGSHGKRSFAFRGEEGTSTNGEKKETLDAADVAKGSSFLRNEPPLVTLISEDKQRREQSSSAVDEARKLSKSSTAGSNFFGWIFTRYIPSPFEVDWLKRTRGSIDERNHDLCKLLRTDPGFLNRTKRYMASLRRCAPNHNPPVDWSREGPFFLKKHQGAGGRGRVPPTATDHFFNDDFYPESQKQCSSSSSRFSATMSHHSTARTTTNHHEEEPRIFDSDIFSRFEYRYGCLNPPCYSYDFHRDDEDRNNNITTSPRRRLPHQIGEVKYAYIEPLVGLLRSPKMCFDVKGEVYKNIIDKNYMVLDRWPLVHGHRVFGQKTGARKNKPHGSTNGKNSQGKRTRRKVYYFDAGASLWEEGTGGNSMSWFFSLYRSMCLHFTEFFAWEGAHAPSNIFGNELAVVPTSVADSSLTKKKELNSGGSMQQLRTAAGIPGPLRPYFRYFNIPLQTEAHSWDNPINHLLTHTGWGKKREEERTAHEGEREEDTVEGQEEAADFSESESPIVIFKIDFDAAELEGQLLQYILDFPEVAASISELFFEHHVSTEVLMWHWGTPNSTVFPSDSIDLFTALRQRGIRAHSWV